MYRNRDHWLTSVDHWRVLAASLCLSVLMAHADGIRLTLYPDPGFQGTPRQIDMCVDGSRFKTVFADDLYALGLNNNISSFKVEAVTDDGLESRGVLYFFQAECLFLANGFPAACSTTSLNERDSHAMTACLSGDSYAQALVEQPKGEPKNWDRSSMPSGWDNKVSSIVYVSLNRTDKGVRDREVIRWRKVVGPVVRETITELAASLEAIGMFDDAVVEWSEVYLDWFYPAGHIDNRLPEIALHATILDEENDEYYYHVVFHWNPYVTSDGSIDVGLVGNNVPWYSQWKGHSDIDSGSPGDDAAAKFTSVILAYLVDLPRERKYLETCNFLGPLDVYDLEPKVLRSPRQRDGVYGGRDTFLNGDPKGDGQDTVFTLLGFNRRPK